MVGRLTPQSGEVKLRRVPTSNALPYGIAVNSRGVPFFAEFGSNKLASVDPATMAIHEYTLPNAKSRPRRIAITPDDAIWYTDYARGRLGRFDPKTGDANDWPSPGGANSGPYGITAVKEILWYSESSVSPNTLVRFDPTTEKFETWLVSLPPVQNLPGTPLQLPSDRRSRRQAMSHFVIAPGSREPTQSNTDQGGDVAWSMSCRQTAIFIISKAIIHARPCWLRFQINEFSNTR